MPLAPAGQLGEAGFHSLPDLPARLRLFVDAYGLTDRTAILPALRRFKRDEPEALHWLQGAFPDPARAPRRSAQSIPGTCPGTGGPGPAPDPVR